MAILISSESIKISKTLSDLFNVTGTSNTKNQASIRFNELLKRPINKESLDLCSKIKAWFGGLETYKTFEVLYHHNSFISYILIQMHVYKTHNGNAEFAMIKKTEKKHQIFDFKNIFSVKKTSSAKTSKFSAEEVLEKHLRFTETEEYCDNIALGLHLTSNSLEILKLFDLVSLGRCFKVPCQAYWEKSHKKWLFHYPSWFDPCCYNTLAAWACAGFERSLWMHYWKFNKLDPRAQGETQEFDAKEIFEVTPEPLADLENFFKGLSKDDVKKILGSPESHFKIFEDVKNKLLSLCPNPPDFCGPPLSQAYFTKHSNMNFQNVKSVELIILSLEQGIQSFFELIFMSSLNRIGSIFDIVAKIIGKNLKDHYNKKLIQDFIVQNDVKHKPNEKEPKKSNKKDKTHSKNNISSNNQLENLEASKFVVKNLMKKIITELYKSLENSVDNIQENDFTGFNIVTQRKSKRPQPQQKSNAFTKEVSKPRLTSRTTKYQPRKPKLVTSKPGKSSFLWECSSTPSIPLSNELDFPPLSAAITQINQYDTLNYEIIRYYNATINKLQVKTKHIYTILDQIGLIVSKVLGGYIQPFGSYATGLAIDTSDIDLAVVGVEFSSRKSLQEACMQLASALEHLPFVVSCKAIITAKIPVIKLSADLVMYSGEHICEMIDITFVNKVEGVHLGLEAITFTRDLIILLPHIKYLAIVLKKFLYCNNLNSAYHGNIKLGGLSSYSLVLWITASLNSMSNVPDDLGSLLEYFLDFFGNKFDPKIYGVNVVNRGSLFLLPEGCTEHAVTVDPINNNNNTTRTSYRIAEVITEFAQAHARLKDLINKRRKNYALKQIFKKFK